MSYNPSKGRGMDNMKYKSKMMTYDPKARLRKALLDNIDNFTITKDGCIISNRETLILALRKEMEKK